MSVRLWSQRKRMLLTWLDFVDVLVQAPRPSTDPFPLLEPKGTGIGMNIPLLPTFAWLATWRLTVLLCA